MKRYFTMVVVGIIALGALLAAAPASAAERTRCFAETGYCVSGTILAYWERNGGLPVFGYPITDRHVETVEGWSGPVQWFERDRLEDHGYEGIGVLAGRLGARLLEVQGRPWESFERASTTPRGCRYFVETGHTLCGVFLTYWQRNGGLERFGYPITQPFDEDVGGWYGTVQYFERRRMELHPENAGTKYEVLLGLLGRNLFNGADCAPTPPWLRQTAAAYGEMLSCLAPGQPTDLPIALASFEHGQMVWVSGTNGGSGSIWVFYEQSGTNQLVWEGFSDTWREGDPVSGGEATPDGLYEPIRGFGKVWRTVGHVRSALGWATTPERAGTGSMLYFKGGAWLIHNAGSDSVLVLRPDNTAEEIARIR
jgi:hypothetical protein